jgi:hypothetical protein
VEKLAQTLGVSIDALTNAMDELFIDLSDYEQSPGDYEASLRSTLGISGGLTVAEPAPTPIVSTKTKAPKGGKLAAKKESGLTAKSKKAQEAQQVQGGVNSALQVQMQAIASEASTTLDGIHAFNHAVGARIGLEIASMPMAIGQIAVDVAQEAAPEMGVNFSDFDSIMASALESIG